MTSRGEGKRKLADALFKLLGNRPLRSITVSLICSEANTERSTFYRNFSSIEDVARYRLSLIMNEYLDSFIASKKYTFERYMVVLFETYQRNTPILRSIYKNGIGECFLDSLQQTFLEAAGKAELSSEKKYLIAFHVGGIYNYMRLWYERDFEDSPEDLAQGVISMLSKNFKPIRLRLIALNK